MRDVTQAHLTREQFVKWMSKASAGQAQSASQSSRARHRRDDIVLAWQAGLSEMRPAICVPRSEMPDFFAFVSTYFGSIQPFSAYFRVIPLELLDDLQHDHLEQSRGLAVARLAAGGGMAEAWLGNRRSGERLANALPVVRTTLSYALGQAVLAGHGAGALDWTLNEWIAIDGSRRNSSPQVIPSADRAWRHVLAAVGTEGQRRTYLNPAIVTFLRVAMAAGTVTEEAIRSVSESFAPEAGLTDILSVSREDRVLRFNSYIEGLRRRQEPDPDSDFVAGLMLAVMGNGSFEMIRSARDFWGWLDGAGTWFGMCAALFSEGNLLSYSNSLGRRLTRDLADGTDSFGPVRADISSTEFRLTRPQSASDLLSVSENSLEIEILPAVVSRLITRESAQDLERTREQEMLVSALTEISRVADKARRGLRRPRQPDLGI